MSKKRKLLLAIARISSLKLQEKLLLVDLLSDPSDLGRLGKRDLDALVGRQTRMGEWRPDSLLLAASGDEKALTAGEFNYTFYWDLDYPPLLREIYNPPFLLFYRGLLPNPERPGLAAVGTRYPTGKGLRTAFRLGFDAGRDGVSVVSGLARGIDCAAHRGNIAAGGKSVAVLGCGIDRMYPMSSSSTARELLVLGGCIMSEYAPGIEPRKYHFPERNRIISGLSRSVIIVEAPGRSGALITADFALEQGRDLFVMTDCLEGKNGEGCRRLYAEGAKSVGKWSGVRTEWGMSGVPEGIVPSAADEEREPAASLEMELKGELVSYAGEIYKR